MDEDLIHFELNNWTPGKDYPLAEPFVTWMGDDLAISFLNEEWVKANNLSVLATNLDMSLNLLITAKKSWVEKECPSLLNEYSEFIRHEEKDGTCYGKNSGDKFLDYVPENIGIVWLWDNDYIR